MFESFSPLHKLTYNINALRIKNLLLVVSAILMPFVFKILQVLKDRNDLNKEK